MKLLSLKKNNPRESGELKIEFSDNPILILSTDYIKSDINLDSWEEGRELSPIEEEELFYAADCYKAEKTALRLIARAEQSSFGLTAKLIRKGTDASVANDVIQKLIAKRLLDDIRYAELWVRSSLKKKSSSPLKLLSSLGKRGVDRSSSKKVLENILDEETEYSLLLGFLEKIDISEINSGSLRSQLKHEGFSRIVIDRYFDSL